MPALRTRIRRPPLEGGLVSAFLRVFRGRNPSEWTIRGYLLSYFESGDVDAKKMGTPLGPGSVRP